MGLYRLQVSQHQLQKDVTHQFSRFLVNRRDDETDFSDMVHIFFRSGLFSHGVLLSQMQNKIIALPVVHRGIKQASTLAGCWPAAYDLGTRRHKLRYATLGQNVPRCRYIKTPAQHDAIRTREILFSLMYWQISHPCPDCSDGGAMLFLAGGDHGRYEKTK